MPRPFRCRLRIHKWVVKQLSPDAPPYVACAYCDALRDNRPENMQKSPNMYLRLGRDHR